MQKYFFEQAECIKEGGEPQMSDTVKTQKSLLNLSLHEDKKIEKDGVKILKDMDLSTMDLSQEERKKLEIIKELTSCQDDKNNSITFMGSEGGISDMFNNKSLEELKSMGMKL